MICCSRVTALYVLAIAAALHPMTVLATGRTEVRTKAAQGLRNFHPIVGFNCIRSSFIQHAHRLTSTEECAVTCNRKQDCQAFSVADGHCKMFVFSKCSKNVRECLCNRLTRIFIKRQPGLRPGALCPAEYTHNRCGVKYKFIHDTNRWEVAMQKCSSEPGLVIMTEPIDTDGFNYLVWLYDTRYKRPKDANNFYFGGRQDPGSVEPAGGWHWSTCRIPIAADMWQFGQPNNANGTEHYACTWRPEMGKLNDCDNELSSPPWDYTMAGAFCECASPFD